MATARDAGSDIVEALRLGANDYVTKPLDFAVVLARSRTQLELKHAHARIRGLALDVERRNAFIRSVFGRYLSDGIVETLLDSPAGLSLGGEKRVISILMTDIRGFSEVASRLPADKIVMLINNFLAVMTGVIMRFGGTIDEFIGDAILVLFNAPARIDSHADKAVACALEMQLAIPEVNRRNGVLGLPAIEAGTGVHTGEVVVGNIGSERRAKYGVVGSHVNLVARIESFTVGGQVLISSATYEACGSPLSVRDRFEVNPKGWPAPVHVYDVDGIAGDYAARLPVGPVETHRRLPGTVPVRVAVLDGKDFGGAPVDAELVSWSGRSAEITAAALEPFTNVRIELASAPDGRNVTMDGKIVPSACGTPGTVAVRITSLPAAAAELLDRLVPGLP
jgi:adenylate cyclase